MFIKTLDKLTPCYQAEMQRLSRQQQKIINYLSDERGGATVKKIATHCFITEQTASGQLRHLREKEYVSCISMGRESYYELQDRIMQFWLDLRKRRINSIKSFLEFGLLWDAEKKEEELTTREIIKNLIQSSRDPKVWRSQITELIEKYNISILGQGLVRNIPELISEMVSDKAAETWVETWQEVGNYKKLRIPLRLVAAAVKYRKGKGDKRVLLRLPIEERQLLAHLLDCHEFEMKVQ
jgi:Mn-dependent DtxR family transcriptional regulator